MKSSFLERGCATRVLVAISFHFRSTRLIYLSEVLRSLSEFSVAAMHVVIVTNTSCQEDRALLSRLLDESLADKTGEVRSHPDLAHPFDLTWYHKPVISSDFIAKNSGTYTHFIYLEDDTRMTFPNLCYFLEYRELLRHFGLLPSFLRMEYSDSLGGFVASDAFWPVYVPTQSHIRLADVMLVNLPNPYNPCFILDAELAAEYVGSPSFDQETSRKVCNWGVRERAAMGLCFEHVPAPFQTRYVVPVSAKTSMAPPFARISHLPNTFANNPSHVLGKNRINVLFVGARED